MEATENKSEFEFCPLNKKGDKDLDDLSAKAMEKGLSLLTLQRLEEFLESADTIS